MTLENANVLYCDDAMRVLAQLEDGSIDAAVFDPPYPTISGGSNAKKDGKHSRPSGILEKNDGKIFAHNSIKPSVYLPEVYRVLREQAHCYLMTNAYNLIDRDIIGEVKRAGFQIHNILPWRKSNAVTNRWYMKDVEYTLFARKGKAFAINDCGIRTSMTVTPNPLDDPAIWEEYGGFPYPLDWDNVSSPKSHPTEKPVNLMRTYIENSTQPGETVLDPFCGTGATGVAAQELGRKFIGIEMGEEYFAKAAIRMNAQVQPCPGPSGGDDLDRWLGYVPAEDIDSFLGI